MHETEADLHDLQRLLDASYRRGGKHLRSIFTSKGRISASALVGLLEGVQVLNLATVTRHCEPRVAPVDGLFYRGHFYFGSSPTSARFTHIRQRPEISASHTRGETLAVLVHGSAAVLDLADPEQAGFRQYCLSVYGAGWDSWGADAMYARIDPKLIFTYHATTR